MSARTHGYRLEGPRPTTTDTAPAPGVRVTSHEGDAYQPRMVRIWHGGESGNWSCAAAVTAGEARRIALALIAAAIEADRKEVADVR